MDAATRRTGCLAAILVCTLFSLALGFVLLTAPRSATKLDKQVTARPDTTKHAPIPLGKAPDKSQSQTKETKDPSRGANAAKEFLDIVTAIIVVGVLGGLIIVVAGFLTQCPKCHRLFARQ